MNPHTAIGNYLARVGATQWQVKAALVDCDGVLYDSMRNHAQAWVQVLARHGIECNSEEFFLLEGLVGTDIIKHKFETCLGKVITHDEALALYATKGVIFHSLGKVPMINGTLDVLNQLKAHGTCCVLVTGSQQLSLLERIEGDYPGIFGAQRVTGHDVTHGKPHPEPYLKGAHYAGVQPSECIVLENAPLGVKAGHAAGCFTIGINTGPLSENDLLDAGADLVYPSMAHLLADLPIILNPNS